MNIYTFNKLKHGDRFRVKEMAQTRGFEGKIFTVDIRAVDKIGPYVRTIEMNKYNNIQLVFSADEIEK